MNCDLFFETSDEWDELYYSYTFMFNCNTIATRDSGGWSEIHPCRSQELDLEPQIPHHIPQLYIHIYTSPLGERRILESVAHMPLRVTPTLIGCTYATASDTDTYWLHICHCEWHVLISHLPLRVTRIGCTYWRVLHICHCEWHVLVAHMPLRVTRIGCTYATASDSYWLHICHCEWHVLVAHGWHSEDLTNSTNMLFSSLVTLTTSIWRTSIRGRHIHTIYISRVGRVCECQHTWHA